MTDQAFQVGLQAALTLAGDRLEHELVRRGRDGVDEPVWYQGAQCGVQRKYSDQLLVVALKGALPSKYSERHELTGANGGPMQLQPVAADGLARLSLVQLEALALLNPGAGLLPEQNIIEGETCQPEQGNPSPFASQNSPGESET
jgi:hypothetical protein